jgi:hypothetical protein
MERIVAVQKLGKILGKSMGYRIDPKAPSPEERTAAQLELPAAVKLQIKIKAQRDERYRAILAADVEYQELQTAYATARNDVARRSSITRHYKITVGISSSMFFHIKAEGDSWEEVIDKLQAK